MFLLITITIKKWYSYIRDKTNKMSFNGILLLVFYTPRFLSSFFFCFQSYCLQGTQANHKLYPKIMIFSFLFYFSKRWKQLFNSKLLLLAQKKTNNFFVFLWAVSQFSYLINLFHFLFCNKNSKLLRCFQTNL